MKFTVLLALSLCVCPLVAADQSLDRFIESRMKEDRIPGLVVGYVRGDETVVRPFGYADVENRTPMQNDSSFRLASITKTMTAVAVLQLVEAGKIELDAEVQRYVPYFPRKPWPITIRQLLGHLGGISHYRNRAFEQHIKEQKSMRETIAIFENFDLVAEPGTKYSYSTYGYALLAAAIEGASGQTYAAYMHDHIFAPLGMTSTREDDPVALIPNRVRGYQPAGDGIVNSEFINVSTRTGGGATRSTVPDMLRFARGLMSGRLLSKASMELMFTPMRTRDGAIDDYAMGCVPLPMPGRVDTNGRFGIMNDGGQQETRTFMMLFPAQNAALFTAMNFEFNDDDTIAQRIAQTLFGEPLDFAPVSADGKDDAVLRAMQRVFSRGVADRDAHPEKRVGDASKMFAKFADEVAGRASMSTDEQTTLGRAMADAIGTNERTPSRGAIAFFADYAKLHPRRLPRSVESRLARWNADWIAATPPAVRTLEIAGDSDFAAIHATLREAFAGRSVRPDLARRFVSATERLLLRGDTKRANEAAATAAELYPASGSAQLALALMTLVAGETDNAQQLIKRAATLDANATDANALNRLAYALAGANHLPEAIALLRIATDLHPNVANLFDSLGELLLRAGDRDAARRAYQQALQVDPTFKNAAAALAKLP